MQPSRIAFCILACGLSAAVSAPARAETSTIELAAMLGGRIIGAAKACGINAERVRKTSERLLSIVNAKAESAAERDSARSYFSAAQNSGAEQIRSEKSKCTEIHVDFSEMEIKLGRTPALDNDPVAVKRGVPALGALKPDAAATRRQ